jgi:hypothetical protein
MSAKVANGLLVPSASGLRKSTKNCAWIELTATLPLWTPRIAIAHKFSARKTIMASYSEP